MAVAPTKNNDRFEWFLEKATEIGISEITPIICEQSERKVLKKERLDRIILSAMKQSLKAYKPQLNDPISFNAFISKQHPGQKYIAHCHQGPKHSLLKEAKSSEPLLILIGPEGDFSVKEIEMAVNQGFIPITLGSARLRTETAALAACHTIALINE
jgi:16S rRNA (uracil1498-N3)-methyltransferase